MIYQLKITLLGTRPPVWRRLLVPGDFALAQLHAILQAAMGWQNSHLHDFRVDEQRFSEPDAAEGDLDEGMDERRVRIDEVLLRAGAKAIYTYDFGDGWEHGIVVEKILPADPNLAYPLRIGGKRACPPEDCGGIGGFYGLLDAIRDPANPEHDDLLQWLGGEYDPEAFSVEAVNQALPRRRRRSRETHR